MPPRCDLSPCLFSVVLLVEHELVPDAIVNVVHPLSMRMALKHNCASYFLCTDENGVGDDTDTSARGLQSNSSFHKDATLSTVLSA